jgi:hypothetical protein
MEGYTLSDMDPQAVPPEGEGAPMLVDPSQPSMDPNVALAEAQQHIAQLQGQLQAMGGQLLHSHQVLLAQVPCDPSGVLARLAPNPAGRAALKPSTPQPFSGTGQSKDNVSSFVFQLDHYFALLNVSDDEHIAANCPQRQHDALRPGVAPNRPSAAIRPTVQK